MGLRRGQFDILADLQPSNDEVLEELNRILGSRIFRGSKRCQEFLQFVVQSALDGESGRLKERTIAVEVFGRKAGAGFSDDSIVRVGAREVRKRLEQYYFTSGIRDPVRISIPPGSYVPAFERLFATGSDAEPVPGGIQPEQKRTLPWTFAFALGALLTLGAFAAASQFAHRDPPEFASFWGHTLESSEPALIAVASETGSSGEASVNFGDSAAAFRLGRLLAGHSVKARLQTAATVEYTALLGSPTLLMGSFGNRWTMETVKSLPYRFGAHDGAPSIDEAAGQRRSWTAGQGRGEYLVISRLLRPEAAGPLLIAAGLTGAGTEEAARILSEPEVLSPLLRRLPPGWQGRSLQMVVRSGRVPELIASQVW